MTDPATGSDDYYNNYFYNGWANYGMAIGNGMLTSPIYNGNGFLRFTDTRVIGFNLGVKGYLYNQLSYIVKANYHYGYGTPYIPSLKKNETLSLYLGTNYKLRHNINISLNVGYDKSNIIGNNWGLGFSISKTGKIL